MRKIHKINNQKYNNIHKMRTSAAAGKKKLAECGKTC